MTSIDFLNKVHKSLDSQEYNLSYSPAKSKNYMLYCNGNFIGGLFDEELCFVYADSVSELLGQPEPVYRGYSSTAQHRMLVIPEEHWAKALKLLYAEKFDWNRLVYDITYTSIGAAVGEDFYDEMIRRHLPEGQTKIANIIGEVLGREKPGIGDVWLAERIRQMLSTGELRMLREDRERFYRSVVERT